MSLQMPQFKGFTLVEFMVAIAIMAILLTLAVPSFNESKLSSQLRASANDLVASANLARSEAIKRRAIVTLCVSSNGSTCGAGSWQQGWIVLNGANVIYHEAAVPNGFHITAAGGTTAFSFQPT